MAVCNVCFRHCDIPEGKMGFCGVRACRDGNIFPDNYGRITSLALDSIEKKPLRRFHPGSYILSAGSYGCNLRCPFCQNYEISWSEQAYRMRSRAKEIMPDELAGIAESCRKDGNIGVAFTYNEPLISYEYVRDTARLLHEKGMAVVLVSNGMASKEVLSELAGSVDAMNIDLKGFTDRYYRDVLKGDRRMVMEFIEDAVKMCHVELTTLIVPGENDSENEIRELAGWIAGLTNADGNVIGRSIPLHISRFFPHFHMRDRGPTPVAQVYRLAEAAREMLEYVYTGNC